MIFKKNSKKNNSINVIGRIDDFTLIINKGYKDGVMLGDEYIVYYIDSKDLINDDGKNWGKLERITGIGEVIDIYAEKAIIKSNRTKIKRRNCIIVYPDFLPSRGKPQPFGESKEKQFAKKR